MCKSALIVLLCTVSAMCFTQEIADSLITENVKLTKPTIVSGSPDSFAVLKDGSLQFSPLDSIEKHITVDSTAASWRSYIWGGRAFPSEGTNNQVLTTDGAGNLFFSDKSGGSAGTITSLNGSSETAQTLLGDNGLTVVDSGTGNYIHKIRPASGRIIPSGTGLVVDSADYSKRTKDHAHVIDSVLYLKDSLSKISDSLNKYKDHRNLINLNSTNYYHLTQTDYTDLTDAGASTLHYHVSDRARANHTGTQAQNTINYLPDSLAAKLPLHGKADSAIISDSAKKVNVTGSNGFFTVKNGSALKTVSGVDSTEFKYLDGVTSSIQTQINALLPKTNFKDSVKNHNKGSSGYIQKSIGSGKDTNSTITDNGSVATAKRSFAVDCNNAADSFWVTREGNASQGLAVTATDRDLYFVYVEDGGEPSPGNWSFMSTVIGGVSRTWMKYFGDSNKLKISADSIIVDNNINVEDTIKSRVVQSSSLTASRVLATDANKNIVSTSTTPTVLGYLDVASSVQGLLNSKLDKGDTIKYAKAEHGVTTNYYAKSTGTKTLAAGYVLDTLSGLGVRSRFHSLRAHYADTIAPYANGAVQYFGRGVFGGYNTMVFKQGTGSNIYIGSEEPTGTVYMSNALRWSDYTGSYYNRISSTVTANRLVIERSGGSSGVVHIRAAGGNTGIEIRGDRKFVVLDTADIEHVTRIGKSDVYNCTLFTSIGQVADRSTARVKKIGGLVTISFNLASTNTAYGYPLTIKIGNNNQIPAVWSTEKIIIVDLIVDGVLERGYLEQLSGNTSAFYLRKSDWNYLVASGGNRGIESQTIQYLSVED